jgi:hypothetical protein
LDNKLDTDLVVRRGQTFVVDTDDQGGRGEKTFTYGIPTDKLLVRGGSDGADTPNVIVTDYHDPAAGTVASP